MIAVLVFGVFLGYFGVFGQSVNDVKNLPKYDTRYDYLDIDAILDSKRLVRNYVDCLINIKPCAPEGKALKRILPEALRTKCIRCTDLQKKNAVKVIKRLKSDYPDEWVKLQTRWDPSGDFTRFFEDYLTKEKYNTVATGFHDTVETNTPSSRPYPPPRSPSSEVVIITPSTPPVPTVQPLPNVGATSPRPVILNRFGDDGELVVDNKNPSSVPPMMSSGSSPRPVVMQPSMRPIMITRPSDIMATRITLRPPTDMPPPYSTAITLIDQIGLKIMRTTELVTDILRNTVRAVVSG